MAKIDVALTFKVLSQVENKKHLRHSMEYLLNFLHLLVFFRKIMVL